MGDDENDLGTFVVGGDDGGQGRRSGRRAAPGPVDAPAARAAGERPPAGPVPAPVPVPAPSGPRRGGEYGAEALIVCDNLVRIYQVDSIEVQALQGLDLLVMPGEMVAIVGASGSGKSTLLNVLSGLDVPTAGRARVADWDLLRMSAADRLTYRRSVVGFIWQQTGRNLLPYLTAADNVMMPLAFSGAPRKKRAARVAELLEALGVAHCTHRRPAQMSGGEQQRVAIAVALANQPKVLFADEPTGELDSATGADVFAALRAANTELGATVVIVTHDGAVSEQVQRTIAIRDGRTSSETLRRTEVDEHGESSVVAEEYAVLDRAGRVQLPREYRMALALRDRVRLELESDHVGVWPDGAPRRPLPAPAAEPDPVDPWAAPAAAPPPTAAPAPPAAAPASDPADFAPPPGDER
ncbi:MAG: ABC transporter ATP-binding protein [Kineosporiaceae bacterium]